MLVCLWVFSHFEVTTKWQHVSTGFPLKRGLKWGQLQTKGSHKIIARCLYSRPGQFHAKCNLLTFLIDFCLFCPLVWTKFQLFQEETFLLVMMAISNNSWPLFFHFLKLQWLWNHSSFQVACLNTAKLNNVKLLECLHYFTQQILYHWKGNWTERFLKEYSLFMLLSWNLISLTVSRGLVYINQKCALLHFVILLHRSWTLANDARYFPQLHPPDCTF